MIKRRSLRARPPAGVGVGYRFFVEIIANGSGRRRISLIFWTALGGYGLSEGQARTAWVGRNSKGPSEAFEGLADGCSIHGLSDGTWSLIDGVEAVCWALARAEKAAEHRAASAGRYRAEAALMEQTLAHRASELVAKDEVEQSWREYVATVGRKLQRLAAMPAFDGCRAALQRELETLLQAHGRVGGDGVR